MNIFRDMRLISDASRLVRFMTIARTLIIIITAVFAVTQAVRTGVFLKEQNA